MKKVFVAGEGRTELGSWFDASSYRPSPTNPRLRGVLEALLRKRVGPEAFQILDGQRWTTIRKYRAGEHRKPETRNILGLCLTAEERGCDVLVFSRDRDRDPEREEHVEEAIRQGSQTFGIALVGGVATEKIEAWLLAILGESKSESHANPEKHLSKQFGCETAAHKSAVVDDGHLDRIPPDAKSLRRWLARADQVFR